MCCIGAHTQTPTHTPLTHAAAVQHQPWGVVGNLGGGGLGYRASGLQVAKPGLSSMCFISH